MKIYVNSEGFFLHAMKVAIIADFTSMKKHFVQVFISEKQYKSTLNKSVCYTLKRA